MKTINDGKATKRRYWGHFIVSQTGINKWQKFLFVLISLAFGFYINAYVQSRSYTQKHDLPVVHQLYDFSARGHRIGRMEGRLRFAPVIQEFQNISIVDHWAAGPCNVISVAGNNGYINNGVLLDILDITKPDQPELTGRLTAPSFIFTMAISGNYLYLIDGSDSLRVVDVRDPASPPSVSSYFMNGYGANAVFIDDSRMYVAAGSKELYIWDVSDPVHTREVGLFETDGYVHNVTMAGKYAYLTDDEKGLRIWDVSNPSNSQEVGLFDTDVYALVLDQNYPNPFNSLDNIRYDITSGGNMSLRVYNVLGQLVITLVEKDQSAGCRQVCL